jgi:hypothetical protein
VEALVGKGGEAVVPVESVMFDYQGFYDHLVEEAPAGSTIVEVGCYVGDSLSYLAPLARKKNIRVIGVDWGLGMPDTDAPDGVMRCSNPTANALVCNLKNLGIPGSVPVIMWDSAFASQFFPDKSCFAVFIDAAHDMYSVRRDIRYWMPKVARGGILCGHDYDWEGVREAVDAQFGPCESKAHNRCWEVRRTFWGWK